MRPELPDCTALLRNRRPEKSSSWGIDKLPERLIQKSNIIDYPIDNLLLKINELIKMLTSIVKTVQTQLNTKN